MTKLIGNDQIDWQRPDRWGNTLNMLTIYLHTEGQDREGNDYAQNPEENNSFWWWNRFCTFYLDVKDILKMLFKNINLFHSHENKTYDF